MRVDKIIKIIEDMDAAEGDAMGVGCMMFADKLIEKLQEEQASPTDIREQAYLAIDTERDYQDTMPAPRKGPGNMGDFILMSEQILQDARDVWYHGTAEDAAEYMRKLAAVGVAAMEKYGAPVRPPRRTNTIKVVESPRPE